MHCNILQHTATHCNTLQHTATHCNTLQHTECATKSSLCSSKVGVWASGCVCMCVCVCVQNKRSAPPSSECDQRNVSKTK